MARVTVTAGNSVGEIPSSISRNAEVSKFERSVLQNEKPCQALTYKSSRVLIN